MKPFFELARVPLSLLTSCSAGAGYVLAAERGTMHRFWEPMAAVFFLAAGASAINQVQERKFDALMERTKGRPIPSGRITPAAGTLFGILLISAGLAFLWWSGGLHPSALIPNPSPLTPFPLLLGLFAILWYNGFYTHAKRASAFAAVPGAIVGAVPPAIGWTLAGGSLPDAPVLMLMVFFFLWQVPHFWLVILLRGEEYRAAGYPVLTDRIPAARLKAVYLLLDRGRLGAVPADAFVRADHDRLLYLLLLIPSTVALCACARHWILQTELNAPAIRKTFIAVNTFALVVLLIVTADRLLMESSKFKVQSSKSGELTAPASSNFSFSLLEFPTPNSQLLSSFSELLTPNYPLVDGMGVTNV